MTQLFLNLLLTSTPQSTEQKASFLLFFNVIITENKKQLALTWHNDVHSELLYIFQTNTQ